MATLEQISRLGAYGRGLLGGLVMAFSLGTAVAIGEIAHMRFGVDGSGRQWLQAIVCSALAVPLIVLLRRRLDCRPMVGLGLPNLRESLRTFGLGVLVTGGTAAVMFGLGEVMGWVRFGAISWVTWLMFIAVTVPIAFLYEALPEELTLRGYAYRNLNAGLRRWTASLCTIALFLMMPVAASVMQAAVTRLLGGVVQSPRLAPAGEDRTVYLILLAVFGATLLVARIVTGSLWAAIAVHMSFLIVNRTVLDSPQITGWSVTLVTPDALLLIPGYLLLAAVLFLLLSRWQHCRIGWRDRDPEP